MKPFNDLGRRGQIGRLRGLALAALGHYDIEPSRIRLLTHWHNTTFRIATKGGCEYMLRVHGTGHLNGAAIRSELAWLRSLRAQTELLVPRPVPLPTGELLTQVRGVGSPQPRHCALFEWMPGRFQRQRLRPGRASAVGALTAQLHNFVQTYQRPPDFYRPVIIGFDLAEPEVMAANFDRQRSIIAPEVPAVFGAVLKSVSAQLEALGRAPDHFNLIHADIHQHNFLFQGDQIILLDFDDCGDGYFVYDMGVTLFYRQRYEGYDDFRAAYLAGYRQHRDFPADQEHLIDSCIALRDVMLGLYVLSRAKDHPDARARAGGYLKAIAARQAGYLA